MFRRRPFHSFLLIAAVTLIATSNLHALCENITVVHPETQIFPVNAQRGEGFGSNVARDDNTLIVSNDPTASSSKQATVYVYSQLEDKQWVQQAELLPNEERQGGAFGYSIDISKDTVVVTNPDLRDVYVFVREENTWVQQSKLSPPAEIRTGFGKSVAIDGDTIVVGEEGAAHVYVRQEGTANWSYQAKLAVPLTDEEYYSFGREVDISKDTIVVSMGKRGGGSASVFVRNPTTKIWTQQADLIPAVEQRRISGGGPVAVNDNKIVIGIYTENLDSESVATGVAYIFERTPDENTWMQKARLVPQGALKNPLAPYGFGIKVAVKGDVVAVLAKNYSSLFSGIESPVYLFCYNENNQWIQQAKILSSTGLPDEKGFSSVALANNSVVAGEMLAKNEQGTVVGAVHVLDVSTIGLHSHP